MHGANAVTTAMVLALLATWAGGCAATPQAAPSIYAAWDNGPPADGNFFPIGVWLQDPKLAGRYKQAGINVYVGLWKGPTEEQLAELSRHGMPVVCALNEVGLKHKDERLIMAWMHEDEPDNAQSMKDYWHGDLAAIKSSWPDAPDRTLERWGDYGPPVPPARLVADYERIRQADPTRPVLVNFGQCVAWGGSKQRGVRTGHNEDYAAYLKGCDVASYDIYPGLHSHADVAGKLELTALGVDRLRKWSGDGKIVWSVIEAAHTVTGSPKKATPEQVRSQVWMSLIHGSRGIIYIVHQFSPRFVEAGLLADTEEDRAMLRAVTALNGRIHSLAAVLNSPRVEGGSAVESSNKDVPVDVMVKRHGGATYLMAAAMRGADTRALFAVKDLSGRATVEVIDEGRTLRAFNGRFADDFGPYGVHLYRITTEK